jgi:type VI secretion system secreted protein VgrG
MLFATPAGIAMSTQKSAHIAANEHVNLVSGQSTHIATGKSLLASVGEKISLFVQNAGMKLFAAKGKVEIKAQSDNVELTAQKTFRLLSATEKIEAAADQEILLTSGGAYIRISGGNIDIHAPGKVDVKGTQHSFNGPTSQGYPLPAARPDQPGQLELLHQYANGEAFKGGTFSVLDANGAILRKGALDGSGHTIVSGLPAGAAQVQFGEDPRNQYDPSSVFKTATWPAQPPQSSGVATSALSRLGGLLPSATDAGKALSGATQFASVAGQAAQGSSGLTQALGGQAVGLVQGALSQALPGQASAALSKASQLGAAAKQISTLAQTARASVPALTSL